MELQGYKSYIAEQLGKIVNIDSPTGYTDEVAAYVAAELTRLGYSPRILNKGGVFVSLGGPQQHPLTLLAHADTLGAVVAGIKADGRLSISNIDLHMPSVETENVRVITRFDGTYEGTIQLENASVHVNPEVRAERNIEKNVEIVLDEMVKTEEDTKKLGILPGDLIALDPRFRITEKGYIKSRFLDDKASVAILLGLAKYLKDEQVELPRRVDVLITVFEEIGHGGAFGIPRDAVEIIAVDMGCVGTGLSCKEEMVSICTKDGSGVYNHHVVNNLIRAAKECEANYAVDIYPRYSSDASCALRVGYDVRAGLIGPGVYASHGYERSHVDGLGETFKLLVQYLKKDRFDD
ncbi:MAG: M42 family metallopeptidase [Firmicutes bacterium]|nr:M42 family metallopeptidase [Bacillota bacterium]